MGGARYVVQEHHTTQTVLNEEVYNERKAAALGVPLKRVLGIKVLLRAGVSRPREKLAHSITSLAPALTLTPPCLCSLLLTGFSTTRNYRGEIES
jgi:hypothetical protein